MIHKTYSPKTDAAIQAREAVREEMEKQRQERRRSQVELIRLHFATAILEGMVSSGRFPKNTEREQYMQWAWEWADTFIKKSESEQ